MSLSSTISSSIFSTGGMLLSSMVSSLFSFVSGIITSSSISTSLAIPFSFKFIMIIPPLFKITFINQYFIFLFILIILFIHIISIQ